MFDLSPEFRYQLAADRRPPCSVPASTAHPARCAVPSAPGSCASGCDCGYGVRDAHREGMTVFSLPSLPSAKKGEGMNLRKRLLVAASGITILAAATAAIAIGSAGASAGKQASDPHPDQVLEWNQIFVETLVATNTANSSSQRLGAIVHTAVFDAYNGIERRYTPLFVQSVDADGQRLVPPGASRRAAVIAAAHTALVGLFPSRATQLDASYAASLAALSDDGGDGGQSRERGIAWGTQVAQAVLAWRAADGFSASYPPFTGGAAVGQWRPIAPATAMSAQGLAFTAPFVVESNTQFRPDPPRGLASATYAADFAAVKALGRRTGSTRTDAQTELAPFWEGNASVHWNQAANQIARADICRCPTTIDCSLF